MSCGFGQLPRKVNCEVTFLLLFLVIYMPDPRGISRRDSILQECSTWNRTAVTCDASSIVNQSIKPRDIVEYIPIMPFKIKMKTNYWNQLCDN